MPLNASDSMNLRISACFIPENKVKLHYSRDLVLVAPAHLLIKTEPFMKFKAVIFDLYGTLVDMAPHKENECVWEMAYLLGAPQQEFARIWFKAFKQRELGEFATIKACIEYVCTAMDLASESSKIMKATKKLLDYTFEILTPRVEAIETLKSLKEDGFKIGLISGCSMEVPLVWPSTQLASLIDVSIFSCQVGISKPDPRIYKEACKQMKIDAEECIYIGDGSSAELRGALAVGMRPALIRVDYDREYDTYRDITDWKGAVIYSLKDVKNLLAS